MTRSFGLALAFGLAALTSSACGTEYYSHHDATLYDDMVCDTSGCFTCQGNDCLEYRCDTTNQCPIGRFCTIDQRCLETDGGATGTVTRPDDGTTGNPPPAVMPGSGAACSAHADCPSGELCTFEGTCVARPVTTDPADPGTDPTDPTDPADPGDPTDPTDPTDPGDPTDPADPADPGDGPIPLPDHPDDVCVINADCGADGMCLDQACYFPCNADGSCAAGQVCADGQCLPRATPENECTFSGECGTAHVCIEGSCLATCNESLECGAHERCDAGLCQADVSPVIECSGAASCAEGAGCFDGKCVATCSAESLCDAGFSCEYGYCHQEVFCLASSECTDDLVCMDGSCQTAITAP